MKGRWSLTPDHELKLEAKETQRSQTFSFLLADASAYELAFTVTLRDSDGNFSARILKFEGRWQADKQNRLVFLINHSDGKRGRLVFQGTWKVGRHHEIIYRFRSARISSLQKMILKGSWQIAERDFLTYRVEGSSDSSFRFKAGLLGWEVLEGKRLRIRYQVAVEFRKNARSKTAYEKVVLSGLLKVHGPLSIGFEITYENGRVEEMRFLAQYELASHRKIDIKLLNSRREGLGIEFALSTRVLGDRANLFLQGRKTERDLAIEGGIKLKW